MSTTVFKNRAPSCFESLLSDTSTTTLKLKMAASPPFDLFQTPPTNPELGNSVFPQTFRIETGDSYSERDNYKGCPWAKKSILSAKSLELCTEALGSETGSDMVAADGAAAAAIFSSSKPIDYSVAPQPKMTVSDGNWKSKLKSQRKSNHSFPPPLTTMSGARSLQVQPHREGGRLIIETVEAPFGNSYLQAVRSDGRLRLRFLTAEGATSAAGEEDEEDDELDGGSAAEDFKAEEKVEEGENEDDEEIDDNLEMEMEKYQWVNRCKLGHGNKGLCGNWKPAFWVATS